MPSALLHALVAFSKAQASAGSQKCLFSACFTRTEERIFAEKEYLFSHILYLIPRDFEISFGIILNIHSVRF